MIKLTVNDSEYYNSEKDNAENNPKIDQLVANHTSNGKKRKVTDNDTTNRNSAQRLWINQLIP